MLYILSWHILITGRMLLLRDFILFLRGRYVEWFSRPPGRGAVSSKLASFLNRLSFSFIMYMHDFRYLVPSTNICVLISGREFISSTAGTGRMLGPSWRMTWVWEKPSSPSPSLQQFFRNQVSRAILIAHYPSQSSAKV